MLWRPSFLLYLAALGLLPFNWLTPFSYEQAGWTDLLVLAAAVAWVIEKARGGFHLRLRPPHLAYAAYLLAGVLSMALVAGGGTLAARNVVIMCELIVLAVLTADFAREVAGRRAIVRLVLAVVAVAAVQGLTGLLVFYLGGATPFEEPFSGYFEESDFYTRIDAGFYGPALLGSFCIFASAVISMPQGGLSRRSQTWAQVALGLLVLSTLSRAVFAFALAIVIREAMIRNTERAHRFALAASAGTIAVIVALTVIPLSASPVRPETSRDDTNPRLATLETSAEEFADRPLLGQGPGELTADWQGDEFRAHLTPLNVAATIGIGGLAALTALIVILWRQRRRPANPSIWSGLAGLGVDALAQDAEHFRHAWIMFGLADADRADERVDRA